MRRQWGSGAYTAIDESKGTPFDKKIVCLGFFFLNFDRILGRASWQNRNIICLKYSEAEVKTMAQGIDGENIESRH